MLVGLSLGLPNECCFFALSQNQIKNQFPCFVQFWDEFYLSECLPSDGGCLWGLPNECCFIASSQDEIENKFLHFIHFQKELNLSECLSSDDGVC